MEKILADQEQNFIEQMSLKQIAELFTILENNRTFDLENFNKGDYTLEEIQYALRVMEQSNVQYTSRHNIMNLEEKNHVKELRKVMEDEFVSNKLISVKDAKLSDEEVLLFFEKLENIRKKNVGFDGMYTKKEISEALQQVGGVEEDKTLQKIDQLSLPLRNLSSQDDNIEKLELDLLKLKEIDSLIIQLISDSGEPLDMKCLEQIGQLINDISWQENNENCIRNKHGYRNRHKNKGNNKNTEGAKLDFETLAHLKDLVKDNDFHWLFEDIDLVKTSLKNLQTKIKFILSSESQQLNTKNDLGSEDVGFLRKASAYYHDSRCINKLINLLKSMDNSTYQSLDLNNKMDKYWLGYFFVQIGETAKEISEFIKPEHNSKAEDSIIRFMFGKLGYYRQKVKANPGIVYTTENTILSEVKQKLEEARFDLEVFLNKIKDILKGQFKNSRGVNDYNSISSSFEEDKNLIINLTKKLDLKDIIKRKNSSLSKKLEALQNEIEELQKAKLSFETKKQSQIEALNSKDTVVSKSLIEFMSSDKKSKTFKALYLICFPHKQDLKIKDIGEAIKNSITHFVSNISQKLVPEEELKLLKKQLNTLKTLDKVFKRIKNSLFQLISPEEKVSELLSIKPSKIITNPESEIESLNSKIELKEKQIDDKQKEKDKILEKLQVQNKPLKILNKVVHEIENLKIIETDIDSSKVEYARKMSIGFLGQYFKEVFQGKENSIHINEILKQDFLFQESIDNAITTRHKYSMHQVFSDYIDVDKKLKNTVCSDVLPWEENILALTFLLCEKLGYLNKVIDFIPNELISEYTEVENELFVLHILITSNIRLQNYSKVRQDFLDSESKISDVIKFSKNGAIWGIGIYIDYFSCLKICGELEEAKNVVSKCLEMIKGKADFEHIREDLQAGLLLISPELHTKFDISSFKTLDGLLCLVDACLEYEDCVSSHEIISVIDDEFIKNNNPTIHQTYAHDHILAKYYRILGKKCAEEVVIKTIHSTTKELIEVDLTNIYRFVQKEKIHLDLCEKNLIDNKDKFIKEVGSRYNNKLFIIKCEQAWNQLSIPHFISVYVDNKDGLDINQDLKNVIYLAKNSLKIYQECNNETVQGFLAGTYLCRGIAWFYLEGKYSENAKVNLLLAKEVYDNNLQLTQNSAKDVEQIELLSYMFRNIEDDANFTLCQEMLKNNMYSKVIIDLNHQEEEINIVGEGSNE